MNRPLSPLSFSSDIRFISSREFRKQVKISDLEKQGKAVTDWTLKGIVYDKEAATDAIKPCVAGGITHKKNFRDIMYHFSPALNASQETLDKISKTFSGTIKNLLNNFGDKVHTLIIGGYNYIPNSFNLANTIKEACDTGENNQTTIFFGQDGADTKIYFNSDKDTWLIAFNKPSCIQPFETPTIENIKQNYDYIHIASEDKVFVGNSTQAIPHELLNQEKTPLNKFAQTELPKV